MKCYVCGEEAIEMSGRSNLCLKHRRFIQMQHTAKHDKKYVPSLYELEKLTKKDMKCQDCETTMNWSHVEGRSTGAVLQHYRNGSIGIVCTSCNVKHGMMVGDSYKDLPSNHKLCGSCKTIKPLDDFYKRGDSKIKYPMTKCKACNLQAHKSWRVKNPDKYKESNKRNNDRRKEVKNELPAI
jgi:hypothetical protein